MNVASISIISVEIYLRSPQVMCNKMKSTVLMWILVFVISEIREGKFENSQDLRFDTFSPLISSKAARQ